MTMNPSHVPGPDETETTITHSAPTAPVATPGGSRGASRTRWVAALAVTGVVVAGAVGATALLTGESPAADVLQWTPSDSVMYGELRLDLPGDQRQQLGSFLSAFPGFDDQAILDQKLGEVMDRVVRGATEGAFDYRTDIDPWFDGQLSVSVGPLPAAGGDAADARFLLLLGVDDATAARAWASEVVASTGGTATTTTHGGVEVTIVEPRADAPHDGDVPGAFATFGPVIAFGDLASVQAAIDTNGSGGLASGDEFRTAAASVTGDRLGFVFVDTDAFMDWSTSMQGVLGGETGVPIPSLPAFVDDLSVDWMAGALRADGDALVFESRTPHLGAVSGEPANRASALAGLVPADTLVLAASHDVAPNLERVLTLLRSDPEVAAGVEEIENATGILGGIEGLTGWIGDLGVVIIPDGSGVAGGLVIDPTDRAAAERLLTTLRSFVTLAGGSAGITVRDETLGAATVTVVTVEDAGALLELAEGMGGTDVPASDAPIDRIEIAYTVTDEVVVLGSSASFVTAVIDAQAGESLAENDRFAALVQRAGSEHSGMFWVDVAGARDRIESLMPTTERDEYTREIRPYVEKLDAVLGTNVAGSDVDTSTMFVTVSE